MPNPYFKFKQFTVFHDKCAMKVGADGVTLGAWVDVKGAKTVLDVGCGSGLIALMLAQRCNAEITAVDIEADCVAQTIDNVENSPWKKRMSVVHSTFQSFANTYLGTFDLIVSNPPFFVNSLKNNSEARTIARHSDSLPHLELIKSTKKLLSPRGVFCVILPMLEGDEFVAMAERNTLFCSKKVSVLPNLKKPAKRLLLEFRLKKFACETSEIILEKSRGVYTEEYADLVNEFYLKL